MSWKFSANAGFFGLRRDRFNQYQPQRSLAEKVGLVARTEGVEGIELKYPADFQDLEGLKSLLDQHGLTLAAINVDTKEFDRFKYGALSSRDAETRRFVVQRLRAAMDVAAELRVDIVTTCPLADAYDYPFQIDYEQAWGYFIDTVRSAATHRADVRMLLEYQPHEPHARIMLNSVGKVLHVIDEVDAPNLGANLDVGHALAGAESPAEAATLLARKNRLFYIHSNDNTGDGGDWDMLSGSIHFWHWLEFLYVLKRINYQGWIGGDIMPKFESPEVVYRTNTRMIQRMTSFLENVGKQRIDDLLHQEGNIAETYDLLSSYLLPSS